MPTGDGRVRPQLDTGSLRVGMGSRRGCGVSAGLAERSVHCRAHGRSGVEEERLRNEAKETSMLIHACFSLMIPGVV